MSPEKLVKKVYTKVFPDGEVEFDLPRGYLSSSAYDLWKKDKPGFRRRYYLNEKPFETVETIFGKRIHEHLEKTRVGREKRIEVKLHNLPLLGYIDEFCDKTLKIRDDKTGHRDAKGKVPWDAVKVRKHNQLVYYAMLVLLKYGKYNPWVELNWIETQFKKNTIEFAGHTLTSDSRELEMTGYTKVFKRRIRNWEIERLMEEVLKAAYEITLDYRAWKATN